MENCIHRDERADTCDRVVRLRPGRALEDTWVELTLECSMAQAMNSAFVDLADVVGRGGARTL